MNSSLSTTIVSPWFDRSNQEYGKCMRFRYLIQGHGSNVQIFQSVFGDEMGKKRIWMDENRMKAVWNYGQISIAAVSKSQVNQIFTCNSVVKAINPYRIRLSDNETLVPSRGWT